MIYSPRNNQRQNSWKILLISFFLILLFFFFGNKFSSLSVRIFSPAMQFYNGFRTQMLSGLLFLEPKQVLLQENENLKEKITELQAQNLRDQAILSESKMLATSTSTGFIETLAISFPPRMPYDTLLIGKGASDGVKIGAKVFLADRVEAGLVEEVFPNQSKIRLFSSSGIKTEAILSRTGEVLEVEGMGSGSFKVRLPINFDIAENDLLSLPGSPRVILAQTVSIKKDEAASLLTAFFSFPIKINGNSFLYVQN